MNYRFKTKDCPDANGRAPQAGEQKWTVYFPTEDGGRVYVEMGKQGRDAMLSMLAQEEEDDATGTPHGSCFACGWPNKSDGCCSRPSCCNSE